MRGVYTAQISMTALNTAKTLILLEVPADLVIEILSARVTNYDTETNEQLEIAITKVTTKGSPTGTAITPHPHEDQDPASGVTATGNLTAEPTTYVTQHVDHQGIPSLQGYHYDPVPEERPIVSPTKLIGLRALTAPTTFKCSAEITFREIGG